MKHAALLSFLFLVTVIGCQVPPDRLPLRPLREDSQPLPYSELLTRARLQSTAATEAFYVSRWTDLEDAATGLEQSARFLGKAIEVPAKHKAIVASESSELAAAAGKLREAAKAHRVKETNEILQRVNLIVRQLRPDA